MPYLCPICHKAQEEDSINAHLDECLTNQSLVEQGAGLDQTTPPEELLPFMEDSSFDQQLAYELALLTNPEFNSAGGETLLGPQDNVGCPYPGCSATVEAFQLPSHAAQNHSACAQALSCPLCERLTGTEYTPNENTNLLQHLSRAHADLVEMEALQESRRLYLEQVNRVVELPKSVGLASQEFQVAGKVPDKECFICDENFSKGQNVICLDCFCLFHKHCLEEWFQKSNTQRCPLHKE